MVRFAVEVLSLANVEPHPNADRLELAVVGNYRVIVGKNAFRPGDLVAYIPEGALLPDRLIEELGIRGYLAGSQHNRVKAAKLRGVLSQGLVYGAREHWQAGEDVAEELGIVKWEPEIPLGMAGEVEAAPGWWQSFDIEAYNRFPQLLLAGEPVYVTEKIHGTCGLFGASEGNFFVSSKGLSDKHLVLRRDEANIYWRAAESYRIHQMIEVTFGRYHRVQIFAEVYGAHSPNGKPVQDLTYNSAFGLRLVVFDIAIDGRFLEYEDALERAAQMGLPAVPLLYHGPFDAVQVLSLAEGRETLTGLHANVREGIVIRPEKMKIADEIGRIVLKHVGTGYLTRTGAHLTEYT